MVNSIKELKVDLSNSGRIQGTVTAMQGDNATRYLHIQVMNNGAFVNVQNYYPVLRGTKPDGKTVFNNCSVVNNVIIAELTSQILAAPGIARFEIALYEMAPNAGNPESGGATIASFPFDLNIVRSSFNATNMTSSDEFKVITDLIEHIGDLDEIEEVVEYVHTLETNIGNHKVLKDVPSDAKFTDTVTTATIANGVMTITKTT